MSLKLKHYSIILVFLVIALAIMTIPAMAAETNYRELPAQNNVSPDKPNWALKFTLPIDQQSLNENNLYIINQTNQSRHSIKYELSADKKTLYIIPQSPYAYNSSYCLYIEEGIRSNTNPAVYFIKNSVMPFTTVKEIPLPMSNDTTISSNQYTINVSAATIIAVPINTSVSNFKANVKLVAGATMEIYQADKTTKRTGNIVNGDILIITAADGTTQKAYNITLITSPSSSSNGTPSNVIQLDTQTLADLREVSQGLNIAINRMATEPEKALAGAIKNNIDQKIANPSFDHTAQINTIRNQYHSLSNNEREGFQDAVLYCIPVQSLMRLAEYFGFR